jgi:hypothetical protein
LELVPPDLTAPTLTVEHCVDDAIMKKFDAASNEWPNLLEKFLGWLGWLVGLSDKRGVLIGQVAAAWQAQVNTISKSLARCSKQCRTYFNERSAILSAQCQNAIAALYANVGQTPDDHIAELTAQLEHIATFEIQRQTVLANLQHLRRPERTT